MAGKSCIVSTLASNSASRHLTLADHPAKTTMNKSQLENIFTLCREIPNLRVHHYVKLCRLANKHRRLCEFECNNGMSDEGREAHEAKYEAVRLDFDRILQEVNPTPSNKIRKLTTYEQRDPRGSTLRLLLPSGRYNTMGGAESGWSL